MIKDRFGCDGYNVFVINISNNQLKYRDKIISVEEFEKIILNMDNGIIQELVQQGSYGTSLFEKSVNTIRIVSMKKKNECRHEVVAALQRIGTRISAPVDNFNQGGLSSIIDIKSGELGKASGIREVDSNGQRCFYSKHPDTDAQIEGLRVPNWLVLKNKI